MECGTTCGTALLGTMYPWQVVMLLVVLLIWWAILAFGKHDDENLL
jgi:hypothetical protein